MGEGESAVHPELKQVVAEASRALARLDVARLEELAMSCQALNRDWEQADAGERERFARQAGSAAADMAVLARVLDATRANAQVMHRLRELRAGGLEYSERQARGGARTERGHGNH